MVEFMDLAKEYGLWAAVSVMLFPWVYTVDKRSRKTKNDLDNVHVSCHIPVGAINELKTEVDELKDGEHSLETRFAVMESSLAEIKADVKSVLNHLVIKGIDK